MTQLQAVTICQAGKAHHENVDCFVNENYIPDRFAQMTTEKGLQEHAMSITVKHTICFAVFNDMGSSGNPAALPRILAEELKKEEHHLSLLPLANLDGLMKRFALHASERIRQSAQLDPSLAGARAGMVCLCLHGGQAEIFQAGPGKAFLYHQNQLTPLGTDQLTSPFTVQPSQVTPIISSGTFPIDDQDRILLCSERLAKTISPDDIRRSLKINDPHQAVASMISAAVSRNDRVNYTATVITVVKVNKSHPDYHAHGDKSAASLPQPHVEHQAKVLPIPPPAPTPKIKRKTSATPTDFNLGHFLFWDVVPLWLQFTGLIALVVLVLLLIWLFGPQLFK